MHEIGLMQETINMALDHAKNQNAHKIHSLKMRVGDLSGVIPEALQFAFDVMINDTIAQGAKLYIETIPVTCYCLNCQTNFQPDDIIYQCPHCDNLSTKILTGKELELTSLEVS